MSVFFIRRIVGLALFCKYLFSFFIDHNSPHIYTIAISLFAYFTGISAYKPAMKKICPRALRPHVLQPLQLHLGLRCWLFPVCTQWSVRRQSRGNGGINDYLWSATSHLLSYPRAPFITAAGCHCVGENMQTHTHTHCLFPVSRSVQSNTS